MTHAWSVQERATSDLIATKFTYSYYVPDYNDKVNDGFMRYIKKEVYLVKHEFTNLNVTVYENPAIAAGKFHTSQYEASEGKGDTAYFAEFSWDDYKWVNKSVNDTFSLGKVDNLYGWYNKWDWAKVGISGITDVVSIGKIPKAVKLAKSTGQAILEGSKTMLLPGMDNPTSIPNVGIASGEFVAAVRSGESGQSLFTRFTNALPIWRTINSIRSNLKNTPEVNFQSWIDDPYGE